MADASSESDRRWESWQRANAVSARRSDQMARVGAAVVFAALLLLLAVALLG